jgi:hypothetical protein
MLAPSWPLEVHRKTLSSFDIYHWNIQNSTSITLYLWKPMLYGEAHIQIHAVNHAQRVIFICFGLLPMHYMNSWSTYYGITSKHLSGFAPLVTAFLDYKAYLIAGILVDFRDHLRQQI